MRVSFISILILISFLSLGQKHSFSRLTEDDGLPGNNAYCFLEDNQGFMWIGTTSGLCRYDGYDFKHFTRDQGYDISDDFINSITQDRDGLIWVGTNGGGINRFDPKTETFTSFMHDLSDPNSIAGDRVRKIVEGKEGVIWIGFDNGIGLSRFNKNTKKAINYDPFETVSTFGVKAIRGMVLDQYDSSTLWLGTTSGLIRFDIESEKFEVIDHPLTKINRHGLFALEQIDENRLIAGFFHAGVDIYDIKKREWVGNYTDPTKELRIYDLTKKSDSEFWVSARRKGLAIYNIASNKFDFVPSDLSNSTTPFPGFTYSVYSKGDQVWIGGKYGVSHSNNRTTSFPFYAIHAINRDLKDISGKYDKIYAIGTPLNGIWEKDKSSGRSVVHLAENEESFARMLELETSIYLIDFKGSISVFDKASSSFTPLKLPELNDKRVALNKLQELSDTCLLVLTRYGGSWKLNTKTHQLTRLHENIDLEDWQSTALLQDDGSLWIGSTRGLKEFNPKSGQLTTIPLNAVSSNEKHIYDIKKDKEGGVWMGTSRGLVKLTGEKSELFDVQNADLPANVITAIEFDADGALWVNTSKGVSKISTQSMEVINYNKSDGIDSEGRLATIDGEIYYGVQSGYYNLSKTIRQHYEPPSVYFTSFQVDHQELKMEKAINYTDELALDYWQNAFSFSFSSPNFSNTQIQYIYRLSGYDKDWVDAKDRRYATYTNLDGGTYQFEVKARAKGLSWGSPKIVTIKLATPFWETWWFYAICTLSIFGVGLLMYNVRIRALQRKADLETQQLRVDALQKRLTDLNVLPPDLDLNFDTLNSKLTTPLSEREFEVLQMSLDGKSNAEIAEGLFISQSTVKFHLRNTYSKLGVSNRKEAFVYVVRES